MTRIWYDTEFLEDGKTIDLISIGMVREDDRTYYAVNSDVNWAAILKHDWLLRNVVPHLPLDYRRTLDEYLTTNYKAGISGSFPPLLNLTDTYVKPHQVIASEVRDFILAVPDPQLWAWYAAYDHVVLCQLWGPMTRLPKGVPMWTGDVKQEAERLGNPDLSPGAVGFHPVNEHDALADAWLTRVRHLYLMNLAA